MDRRYAEPLDVPTLARIAHVSEAHFIRTFRATFGETPHRYLQRRRGERAMFLLRTTDRSVTDVCMAVGFSSLGTFSLVFRYVVGEPPAVYRAIGFSSLRTFARVSRAVAGEPPSVARRRGPVPPVPTCFAMAWARPSSSGKAPGV